MLRENENTFTNCEDVARHRHNAIVQRSFFDNLAPSWREAASICPSKIDAILENIPIEEGGRVLDVACGAGVLEEGLIRRGAVIDAIDISPLMIEKAKKNVVSDKVKFIVANFYEYTSDVKYDNILVFDAYPHFFDKVCFAKKSAELLKDGGTLFIFFDESRNRINAHHADHKCEISVGLASAEQEAKPFEAFFDVIYVQDDENGYCLGLKRRSK
ncbi:MAG: class I SAM-dependent methyltransferase [Clostridia bacterium]|nr:class I SAM-dependent methyltransferase [Clostridia bacterium]